MTDSEHAGLGWVLAIATYTWLAVTGLMVLGELAAFSPLDLLAHAAGTAGLVLTWAGFFAGERRATRTTDRVLIAGAALLAFWSIWFIAPLLGA